MAMIPQPMRLCFLFQRRAIIRIRLVGYIRIKMDDDPIVKLKGWIIFNRGMTPCLEFPTPFQNSSPSPAKVGASGFGLE